MRPARSVGTLDSFGYWDGFEDRPPLEGPLTPPVLARSLAEMVVAGATHAIVEFSSLDLAQQVLGGRDARWRLHHATSENIISTCTAPSKTIAMPSGEFSNIWIPMQWPSSMRMTRNRFDILDELTRPVLTYGLQKPCEITAHIVEQYINEQTFVLSAGDESVGVRTEIVGDHHVYNCLAAATTALAYGVELTTIARGLEAVDRLAGSDGTRDERPGFRRARRRGRFARGIAKLLACGT